MTYLLDSNICIDHMRSKGETALMRALASVDQHEVALSSVVVAELIGGCHRAVNPAAELAKVDLLRKAFTSLPFDDVAAEIAGRVFGALSASGNRIGANDLFIAAIALANDLVLVTHNTKEFSRVAGLRLEDWQAVR